MLIPLSVRYLVLGGVGAWHERRGDDATGSVRDRTSDRKTPSATIQYAQNSPFSQTGRMPLCRRHFAEILQYWAPYSAGVCPEVLPALKRAPAPIRRVPQ